jgi:hypothetical protein
MDDAGLKVIEVKDPKLPEGQAKQNLKNGACKASLELDLNIEAARRFLFCSFVLLNEIHLILFITAPTSCRKLRRRSPRRLPSPMTVSG